MSVPSPGYDARHEIASRAAEGRKLSARPEEAVYGLQDAVREYIGHRLHPSRAHSYLTPAQERKLKLRRKTPALRTAEATIATAKLTEHALVNIGMNRRAMMRAGLAAAGTALLFNEECLPIEGPGERQQRFFEQLIGSLPEGQRLIAADPYSFVRRWNIPERIDRLLLWVDDHAHHELREILAFLHARGVPIERIFNADRVTGEQLEHSFYTDHGKVTIQNAQAFHQKLPAERRHRYPNPQSISSHAILKRYIGDFFSVQKRETETHAHKVVMVINSHDPQTDREGYLRLQPFINQQDSDGPAYAVVGIGASEEERQKRMEENAKRRMVKHH